MGFLLFRVMSDLAAMQMARHSRSPEGPSRRSVWMLS